MAMLPERAARIVVRDTSVLTTRTQKKTTTRGAMLAPKDFALDECRQLFVCSEWIARCIIILGDWLV